MRGLVQIGAMVCAVALLCFGNAEARHQTGNVEVTVPKVVMPGSNSVEASQADIVIPAAFLKTDGVVGETAAPPVIFTDEAIENLQKILYSDRTAVRPAKLPHHVAQPAGVVCENGVCRIPNSSGGTCVTGNCPPSSGYSNACVDGNCGNGNGYGAWGDGERRGIFRRVLGAPVRLVGRLRCGRGCR